MKITKSQLKRLINEEMEADPALLSAIEKLTSKIEGLDVSIDYLASAVTGEDAVTLGFAQDFLGRWKRKPAKKAAASMEEIIREELEAYLQEDKDHPGKSCDEAHPDQEHKEWAATISEVSSEKQRRWACAQKDKPASGRADSLSAAEAEEMCKSKIEEDG